MPPLFGSAYAEASPLLRITGPAVTLLFFNGFFIYLLTALGRERDYMRVAAVGAALNLGLDLLLIPVLGYPGAAVAAVLSEAGIFVVAIHLLAQQGLRTDYRQLLNRPIGAVIPAALLLLWPLYMGTVTAFLVASCGFGVLYLLGARITGAPRTHDLQALRQALKR